MDTLSYKTVSANKESANKEWLLVDAEGESLGRLASRVATLLRGKHKPCFTPHADCGDYVVVVNAEKVNLTGNKWRDKEYMHYTGYPGGQRTRSARDLMEKKPTAMVEKAVRGMLPKNSLGRECFRHMFVYAGGEHDKQAQKPKEFKINS